MDLREFPIEIFQKIAYHSGVLDHKDVLNLILTCKDIKYMLRENELDLVYHRMLAGFKYCWKNGYYRECYLLTKIIHCDELHNIFNFIEYLLYPSFNKNVKGTQYFYFLKLHRIISDYAAEYGKIDLAKHIVRKSMAVHEADMIDCILNDDYEYNDYYWNIIIHNKCMFNNTATIFIIYHLNDRETWWLNNVKPFVYVMSHNRYEITRDDFYLAIVDNNYCVLEIILEHIDPSSLSTKEICDMINEDDDPHECFDILLKDPRFEVHLNQELLSHLRDCYLEQKRYDYICQSYLKVEKAMNVTINDIDNV